MTCLSFCYTYPFRKCYSVLYTAQLIISALNCFDYNADFPAVNLATPENKYFIWNGCAFPTIASPLYNACLLYQGIKSMIIKGSLGRGLGMLYRLVSHSLEVQPSLTPLMGLSGPPEESIILLFSGFMGAILQ